MMSGRSFDLGMPEIVLDPVQECQRGSLGLLKNAGQVGWRAVENRFRGIVLPRPVHQRDLRRLRDRSRRQEKNGPGDMLFGTGGSSPYIRYSTVPFQPYSTG